jgi:HSP20 family protein
MGYAEQQIQTKHNHDGAHMPLPLHATMTRVARQRWHWRLDAPPTPMPDESPIRRMWDDVQRAFDRILTPFGEEGWATGSAWPMVDMFERAGQLVIVADVPGMRLDELHLHIEDGMLQIVGERRPPIQRSDLGCHRLERRQGHFARSVPLPVWADNDRIHARLDAGVLEVSVPMPPETKGRTIPIRDGSRES